MKKHLIINAIQIVIILCFMGAMYFVNRNVPKIGFVYTDEVLLKYDGMIDAHEKFSHFSETLEKNAEQITANYHQSLEFWQENKHSLMKHQIDSIQYQLNQQRQSVGKYHQLMDERKNNESETVIEGVLTQINAAIYEYGELHDFDVILGTGQSGNLMYANDAIDLTEEILNYLNARYTGNHDVDQ